MFHFRSTQSRFSKLRDHFISLSLSLSHLLPPATKFPSILTLFYFCEDTWKPPVFLFTILWPQFRWIYVRIQNVLLIFFLRIDICCALCDSESLAESGKRWPSLRHPLCSFVSSLCLLYLQRCLCWIPTLWRKLWMRLKILFFPKTRRISLLYKTPHQFMRISWVAKCHCRYLDCNICANIKNLLLFWKWYFEF